MKGVDFSFDAAAVMPSDSCCYSCDMLLKSGKLSLASRLLSTHVVGLLNCVKLAQCRNTFYTRNQICLIASDVSPLLLKLLQRRCNPVGGRIIG
jgi:hypothetical protein